MAEILVADDDPDVRMVLERVLRRGGFTVLSAADGQEALDLAGSHHPDLVLTDLDMPKMNGLQLCTALRADAGLSTTPVALISGSLYRNDPRAIEAQACAIQFKPFTNGDLVAAMHALLDIGPHGHGGPDSPCPLAREVANSSTR